LAFIVFELQAAFSGRGIGPFPVNMANYA